MISMSSKHYTNEEMKTILDMFQCRECQGRGYLQNVAEDLMPCFFCNGSGYRKKITHTVNRETNEIQLDIEP